MYDVYRLLDCGSAALGVDEEFPPVDSLSSSSGLCNLDCNTNDRRWKMMGGQGSGSGGKRKGAGRPSSNKENTFFWISTETIELLRQLIPADERSPFVEGAIRTALKRKAKQVGYTGNVFGFGGRDK